MGLCWRKKRRKHSCFGRVGGASSSLAPLLFLSTFCTWVWLYYSVRTSFLISQSWTCYDLPASMEALQKKCTSTQGRRADKTDDALPRATRTSCSRKNNVRYYWAVVVQICCGDLGSPPPLSSPSPSHMIWAKNHVQNMTKASIFFERVYFSSSPKLISKANCLSSKSQKKISFSLLLFLFQNFWAPWASAASPWRCYSLVGEGLRYSRLS